jgi:predicted DNA-binding transcriptional regulator AlpA
MDINHNRTYTPTMKKAAQASPVLIAEDELLTVDELTTGLKLPSRNWLYQHVHAGTLPFPYLKIGHYLRFPASGVRKYLESQTRNGSVA